MRRKAFIGAVAGLALALTFTLLPSGAGQHYSAVIQSAARAIGGLSGGSSAANVPPGFPVPNAEITFAVGREIGVGLTPLGLINDSFGIGCIEMRLVQGVDKGCQDFATVPLRVFFLPGLAVVHFEVPSRLHPGGTLATNMTIIGTSLPQIVPTLDLVLELGQRDIFVGPLLSLVQRARANGTVTSSTFGQFTMINGQGELVSGIGAEVEQCAGDCIEPEPEPEPSEPPCVECEA